MRVIPAKWFLCPSGNKVEMKDCFKHCSEGKRCMVLPALKAVGKTRAWYGKPSVTQLLQPTLPSYLAIKYDYAIDPQASIASMIGTQSHSLMEGNQPNGWLSEIRLEDDLCSGQFDAVDLQSKTLVDFKFFGAYRVAGALGYRGRWTKVGQYVKGKNKGQDKWQMVYDPGGVRDILEIAIQLSYYRKLLADHGIDIENIRVQMFIRGGLDKTAKSYGLDRMSYVIPIFPLPIAHVRKYMEIKHDRLMKALETDTMPETCSEKERWSTKSRPDFKCQNFCQSNINCPYYQEKYMKTE